MIKRILEHICFNAEFGRQMRFIAGPRQSGKTTLARMYLKKGGWDTLYYNWDIREIRNRYRQNPSFYWSDFYELKKRKKKKPWVCFDEIHKMPKWKDILKSVFDSAEEKMGFIVTGSARLEMFRRSGDSLAGRYFMFRLYPVTLFELTYKKESKVDTPPTSALDFIDQRLSSVKYYQELMETILSYSGFPEPFLRASKAFSIKWHDNYVDRLVREDLRDLTRIHSLENIAALIELLPERIASPLSLKALSEDIEVSHSAIRSYLRSLNLCYIILFLRPYSKSLARSVRKEQKCYLYDFSMIKDPSKRYENYIAVELKALTGLWNDAGLGRFDLFFVRTRDGKETDFLVTKEGLPWILFEAKLSDSNISSHHYRHARALGNIPVVQLIAQTGIAVREQKKAFRISASRFFGH